MSHMKHNMGRGEKGTKRTLEDSMHLVVLTRFRRLAGLLRLLPPLLRALMFPLLLPRRPPRMLT